MPRTALIVEDEIFVALDLERILLDAGYRVAAIAADHDSAMEAAGEAATDPGCQGCFAFVDINLRDGPTGPEIARRMARDHGIKVVFVTANPTQIGADHDAVGYIRKPFTERAILAAAAACSAPESTADSPTAANDDLVRLDRGVG